MNESASLSVLVTMMLHSFIYLYFNSLNATDFPNIGILYPKAILKKKKHCVCVCVWRERERLNCLEGAPEKAIHLKLPVTRAVTKGSS
jgi:hypothetical protein